jgi:hypothetical protein
MTSVPIALPTLGGQACLRANTARHCDLLASPVFNDMVNVRLSIPDIYWLWNISGTLLVSNLRLAICTLSKPAHQILCR